MNFLKILDIAGTIAFAISGLLLAFRYNYDIFGAFVLASLTAVGGGVVRDLITNRGELAVLASPIYVEIIIVVVIGGYFTLRLAVLIQKNALGVLSESQMNWLEIAVFWGLILSLYFMSEGGHLNADHIRNGILVTFTGALVTRMLTIHLGWKSPRFSA